MKTKLNLLLLIIIISLLSGCAPTIKYEIKDEETVTGSDWSAKDLKDVSDYMAASVKQSAFVASPQYANERPRWMLARDMKNETDEHVNTRTIMEKIRTRLINGGIANFIDDQAVEDILNQMKLQQSGLFDSKTVAQVGKLVGAKLILRGTISSIRKKTERKDIIYYNITLQLVNIQTGEIIWTDEKEIQRLTSKSMFR
ncbi:MAG: penicillin-binding protein activator LpoB [Deltaproteobacteria bacterium HGW-Deltaproteobacteria-10]|nr:MAG: penicillin-binding protein activator LpoB [Deltaproteobacteria bacterium HGW-Deltaproteobacteria-10]